MNKRFKTSLETGHRAWDNTCETLKRRIERFSRNFVINEKKIANKERNRNKYNQYEYSRAIEQFGRIKICDKKTSTGDMYTE